MSNTKKLIEGKKVIPIEYIHLTTGYVLIISWVISYFSQWLEMFLAWAIFGCMYISMSDIWECSKCTNELCSLKHKNRRIKAYAWMTLSVILLIFYLSSFVLL